MKYLDEQITITISGLLYIGGTFRYDVIHNSETIFTGNIYLEPGSTSATFDITDIVRNYKDNGSLLQVPFLTYNFVDGSEPCKPIDSFRVFLYVDSSTIKTTDDIYVAMMYRYPHIMNQMKIPVQEPTVSTTDKFALMLQGGGETFSGIPLKYQSKLLPHYPYVPSNNYGAIFLFQTSNNSTVSYPPISMVGPISGSGYFEYNTMWVGQRYSLYDLFVNVLEPSSVFVDLNNSSVTGNAIRVNNGVMNVWTNNEEVETLYRMGVYYGDGTAAGLYERYFSGSVRISNQTIKIPIKITTTSMVNRLKTYGLRIWFNRSYRDEGYISLPLTNIDGNVNNWVGRTLIFKFNWAYDDRFEKWSVKYESVWIDVMDENGKEDESILYVDNLPIAKVDLCPAKFYLMWQDRGGSYQSQPFDKASTYSEDFTRNQLQNYKGETRDYNVIIKPKWKVSSNWIPEEEYPYYESIFVSPKLLLYDVEEDHSYFVTIKGNYTEKHFKNQRRFINLELDLEENKSQNILY